MLRAPTLARAARGVARPTRSARKYTSGVQESIKEGTTNTTVNDFLAERAAAEKHAAETTKLWKNVTYFVCLPACVAIAAWTYKIESEHFHHLDHVREENGGTLPSPPAYEYLNIRNKPFPWGMQSLFFNPKVNTRVESD